MCKLHMNEYQRREQVTKSRRRAARAQPPRQPLAARPLAPLSRLWPRLPLPMGLRIRKDQGKQKENVTT